MKANYADKTPKKTAEVSLGNLYDINKQMMANEPVVTMEERASQGEHLERWLETFFPQKYFMMLCHERRDYTLFNLDKTSSWAAPAPYTISTVCKDIFECLDNRGDLISIEQQPDNTWEFWIRTIDDQCVVYYLFPYGEAVLEY